MDEYHREHLKTALFHAKECAKSIARARKAVGDDDGLLDDEPSADYDDDPPLLVPRGRYPRLIG
jgi:hypothetical protein